MDFYKSSSACTEAFLVIHIRQIIIAKFEKCVVMHLFLRKTKLEDYRREKFSEIISIVKCTYCQGEWGTSPRDNHASCSVKGETSPPVANRASRFVTSGDLHTYYKWCSAFLCKENVCKFFHF